MGKKETIELPEQIKKQFNDEYQEFCKWARTEMSKTEFMEYVILQSKHKRTNHRVMWQFYSITPTKIGILDRKKREKVIVHRVHDYLYCEKAKHLYCGHCLYCLTDKDVKKSLNPKYVWYITHAYKPKIDWPKITGQKLDFEKIIGSKTFLDEIDPEPFDALDV